LKEEEKRVCTRCGEKTDGPFEECFRCITDLSTWEESEPRTGTFREALEITSGKRVLPS